MKKLNFKDIVKPTMSLFIICLVVTFLLAGTNILTKQSIEKQNIKNDESAKRIVIPNAASFRDETTSNITYSVGVNDSGNIEGYVFHTESKGYGGTIEVMTGISPDSKILGVTILSQNETPGLGANITNDNFIAQFCKPILGKSFTVKKCAASADNEINAITGATISSKAVTEAVNEALSLYNEILNNA